MPPPDIDTELRLDEMSRRALLRTYAGVLETLRKLGIVRTANNPAADYAELLVCSALRLEQRPNSTKGFDATDPANGDRYEVKARRITPHAKATRLSPVRGYDSHHFDYLAIAMHRACRAPCFSPGGRIRSGPWTPNLGWPDFFGIYVIMLGLIGIISRLASGSRA